MIQSKTASLYDWLLRHTPTGIAIGGFMDNPFSARLSYPPYGIGMMSMTS